jgi:glycerophosphoryl diester phosphodiesterase
MAGDRRPLVIAHRGSSRAFPENTAAAFDAARSAGADAVELDLQLSRDAVPVAYHDRTLAKVHGGRRRVAQLDLDELRELDFGAWFAPRFRGEPVPRLSELLVRYPAHVQLMLELKVDKADTARRTQLAHAVVDLVNEHNVARRVWYRRFARAPLQAARRRAPDLRYVLNVAQPPPLGRLGATLKPFSALCLPGRAVSRRLVSSVHQLDREIFTYRCDTARVAGLALRAGVDGLMADDPGALRKRVARGLAT